MSAMGLRYGIPPDVEAEIWARDLCCVYCGKAMDPKSPTGQTLRRSSISTICRRRSITTSQRLNHGWLW
jgi:hypothetical protein